MSQFHATYYCLIQYVLQLIYKNVSRTALQLNDSFMQTLCQTGNSITPKHRYAVWHYEAQLCSPNEFCFCTRLHKKIMYFIVLY